MQNSMRVISFSVLEWRYSFLENLVQKNKIASLRRNLLPAISFTKYLRQTLVLLGNSAQWKSSISVFQESFTSTDKIFISGKELSTRQLFCEIICVKWNLILRFVYAECSGEVRYFNFRPEIPILRKFDPKTQNF